MRNWSTDTTQLQKNPDAYNIWVLEQMVNYGIGEDEHIERNQLEKYWDKLDIDPYKRSFLAFILDYAQPNTDTN